MAGECTPKHSKQLNNKQKVKQIKNKTDMKKNAMILAFINALIEDKFVVVPDLLVEDFVKAADRTVIGSGREAKPLFYSGGVYYLPQECEEYPLGGQGFYID